MPGALAFIAGSLVASGRFEEARDCALESVDLRHEAHNEAELLEALHHLAAIAALRGGGDSANVLEDRRRSARLVGYINARIAFIGNEQVRWVKDDQERDQTLNALCNALGADELAQLIVGGAAMSEERAVELARSI